MKSIAKVLACGAIIIGSPLLSGCQNLLYNTQARELASDGVVGGSYNYVQDGEYECPADDKANILPDYDRHLNGSGYYTVCKSRVTTEKIRLHGKTADPRKMICVFPVAVYDDNRRVIKWDMTGKPWSKCGTLPDEQSIVVGFELTTYNAVFVVNQEDRARMVDCFLARNESACPDYSYGQFSPNLFPQEDDK